jgi:hypothetical protein
MPKNQSPQLPMVRPPRPPYIAAFERFTHGKADQIEAFVAFGLFISSDYGWASEQAAWPAEVKIAETYERLLHDDEVMKTERMAKEAVDSHRDKLVREHEKKYLEGRFQDIEMRVDAIATKAAKRHFRKGVLEATTGAFCWTMLVIAIAYGARLVGIDLFHGVTNIGHVQAETTPPVPNAPK